MKVKKMGVEVAYATRKEQLIISVQVDVDSTVETVIVASGILERFPDIDLPNNKVGVFGKACKLDRVLRAGDRIEIYRPLIADPKKVRKERAASGS